MNLYNHRTFSEHFDLRVEISGIKDEIIKYDEFVHLEVL